MENSEAIANLRTAKRLFWSYLAISFISGLFIPDDTSLKASYNIVFIAFGGFFPFLWVRRDSEVMGLRLGRPFKVGVATLGLVFIPAYVFRTRGFARGILAILKFLFLVLCLIIAVVMLFVSLHIAGLIRLQA